MERVNTIDGPRKRRDARRRVVIGLRAGLAAFSIAGFGTACLAAESISGLGSAFRPQAGADMSSQGGGRSDGNQSGLRVVVSSSGRSVASIDGQIVRVGDVVNGMRVTRIEPHGVLLIGEGVQEQLMVNPSVVKRMRPVAAKRVSSGARQ
jgi:hypothetical protein